MATDSRPTRSPWSMRRARRGGEQPLALAMWWQTQATSVGGPTRAAAASGSAPRPARARRIRSGRPGRAGPPRCSARSPGVVPRFVPSRGRVRASVSPLTRPIHHERCVQADERYQYKDYWRRSASKSTSQCVPPNGPERSLGSITPDGDRHRVAGAALKGLARSRTVGASSGSIQDRRLVRSRPAPGGWLGPAAPPAELHPNHQERGTRQ
jgi:hypothetical protein